MVIMKDTKVEVGFNRESRRLLERIAKSLEAPRIEMHHNNPYPQAEKLPTPRMQKALEELTQLEISEHDIELYLRIVECFGELDEEEDVAIHIVDALCRGLPLRMEEQNGLH